MFLIVEPQTICYRPNLESFDLNIWNGFGTPSSVCVSVNVISMVPLDSSILLESWSNSNTNMVWFHQSIVTIKTACVTLSIPSGVRENLSTTAPKVVGVQNNIKDNLNAHALKKFHLILCWKVGILFKFPWFAHVISDFFIFFHFFFPRFH